MSQFVALRLRKLPVIHWFLEPNLALESTQKVVVRTQHGQEVATVLRTRPTDVPIKGGDDQFVKEILRLLTPEDQQKLHELCQREREAFLKARALVAQHKLDMKLLRAEYLFDQSRLLFYFKSEIKVDFRDLLRSLGQTFRTRIELRQIGVRDEARLLGGIGCCGKEVCCAQFMTSFGQVSTKMAKDQNLSLNPEKLSGICGRLLCCLAHEHEYYASFHGKYPKLGAEIAIGSEKAKVMDINFITQKALVGFLDRRKLFVPLAQIKGRKEPVTGRNLWWSQEEGQPEPDLDTLLAVYGITEVVQKAREAKEAKEARKREKRQDGAGGPGAGQPRSRRAAPATAEGGEGAGSAPATGAGGTARRGPAAGAGDDRDDRDRARASSSRQPAQPSQAGRPPAPDGGQERAAEAEELFPTSAEDFPGEAAEDEAEADLAGLDDDEEPDET